MGGKVAYLEKNIDNIPVLDESIALKYSLSIEAKNDGDPVEIILGDRILLTLLTIFAIIIL